MKSLYELDSLYQFSVKILKYYEVPEGDAELVTDTLLEANLRGVDTHGIVRLPTYVTRIIDGSLNPKAIIQIDRETTSFVSYNCGGGFGQVVANKAMDMAIDKALLNGIGIAAVKNSNHFGVSGYYAMKASNRKLVGVTLSNAAPRLPAWGGNSPVLGNNPWSIAVPTGEDFSIVVDMANSAAAMGKIRLAAKANKSIPFGWALNSNGLPTDNPLEALEGILLPMAGHKGYSITLLVDIFAGVLTGASFGKNVKTSDTKESSQDVGHLLAAIDIEMFMSFAEYQIRIKKLIDDVKSSSLAEGVKRVYLPGEIEHLCKLERMSKGIPLQVEVVNELNSLGKMVGIQLN